jgi:hypothetical protein
MSPTRSPIQLRCLSWTRPSERATVGSLDRHWLRSQSSLSQWHERVPTTSRSHRALSQWHERVPTTSRSQSSLSQWHERVPTTSRSHRSLSQKWHHQRMATVNGSKRIARDLSLATNRESYGVETGDSMRATRPKLRQTVRRRSLATIPLWISDNRLVGRNFGDPFLKVAAGRHISLFLF